MSEFQKQYHDFRGKRNTLFELAKANGTEIDRAGGETNAAFGLRLATSFVLKHVRTNDNVDQAADAVRVAGRNIMYLVESRGSEFDQAYLDSAGMSEITNVFLVTTPLDAINAMLMGDTDVPIDSWTTVLRIMEKVKDKRSTQWAMKIKEATDYNPWPERDVKYIQEDLKAHKDQPRPKYFEGPTMF